MAMNPAGLDPVKLQALNPRLALPNLLRCQTSLNSLIYGANFRNYVRGTNSPLAPILAPYFGSFVIPLVHKQKEAFNMSNDDCFSHLNTTTRQRLCVPEFSPHPHGSTRSTLLYHNSFARNQLQCDLAP